MKANGILLALTIIALPARAYPQTAASNVADKHTDETWRQGVRALDEQRYEDAWAWFKQAYALNKTPKLLHNVAFAAVKSGHYLEAARLLSEALPCDADCPEELKQYGPELLEEANRHVGRLQVRVPVKGVRVEVDGFEVPSRALTSDWHVAPGEHRVTAYAANESESTQVSVGAGQVRLVELSFRRGEATLLPTRSKPRLAEQPRPAETSMATQDVARDLVLWMGVGIAATATGLGTYFWTDARDAKRDAQRYSGTLSSTDFACYTVNSAECRQLQDAENVRRVAAKRAQWSFVTAGLVGAATVTTYVLWPKRQSNSISLALHPEHALLTVSGPLL